MLNGNWTFYQGPSVGGVVLLDKMGQCGIINQSQ